MPTAKPNKKGRKAPPERAADEQDIPTDLSPGARVYGIPEVLQVILRGLTNNELSRMMRVSKGSVEVVARELYRITPFDRAWSMETDSPRGSIYASSVVTIQAETVSLPRNVRKQLETDDFVRKFSRQPKRDRLINEWLQEFRPEAVEFLVKPLKRKFMRLLNIYFGCHQDDPAHYGRRWNVNFDPDRAQAMLASTSVEAKSRIIGHIDVVRAIQVSYYKYTPIETDTATQKVTTAMGDFVLCRRFDLNLHSSSNAPPHSDWLPALASHRSFGQLSSKIHFGRLPVDIGLIGSMYQRQIAANHQDRLSIIEAPYILPWNLVQFASFARIASTFLVSLDLGWHKTKSTISLSSLKSFANIIREFLPNLKMLTFAMSDDDIAESNTKAFLHPRLLEVNGTITNLQIVLPSQYHPGSKVPDTWVPAFNLLRLLCPLIAANGSITLGQRAVADGQDIPERTAYVQYLKRQSPERRNHLSTLQFKTLGISTYQQVLQMEYDPSGQPLQRLETLSKKWRDTFVDTVEDQATQAIADLQASLRAQTKQAPILHSASKSPEIVTPRTGATTEAEKERSLRMAKRLKEAVIQMESLTRVLKKTADEMIDELSPVAAPLKKRQKAVRMPREAHYSGSE